MMPTTSPPPAKVRDLGLIQKRPERGQNYDFEVELAFTDAYKTHHGLSPAIREAACLRAQYPATLGDIENGDLFAGRVVPALIGFSPDEWGQSAFGYYCLADEIDKALSEGDYESHYRRRVEHMLAFWKSENTATRLRASYPLQMAKYLPSDNWMGEAGIAFPLYRLTGGTVNFSRLLAGGIPGMRLQIEMKRRSATSEEHRDFLIAADEALDLLSGACSYYSEQAQLMALETGSEPRRRDLLALADAACHIAGAPPRSFREAIQLFWLYSLVGDIRNYGRMDVYLGPFLAADLDAGNIDEEEALRLLVSLWRLMADRSTRVHGRIIVGGRGRMEEADADRFALLAMEATRRVPAVEPQLSLRWYEGMNPALFQKALDVLAEGRTFPILYNDDVNIAAVERAFGVRRKTAEQYVPYGCGEYIIEGQSFGTPSGVINLLKALEVTLRNGSDSEQKPMGLSLGHFDDFETFEELWKAYTRQVEHFVALMADHEKLEYDVAGNSAAFLYMSMLYDDCISRATPIFSGGLRYLGGTLETYGNVSVADSLLAIKDLVYDRGLVSASDLLSALDVNFEGYPHLRRMLSETPKFGNDNDVADEMLTRVHEHVCNFTRYQADRVGLHSYLVVVINNSANALMGRWTGASPDGRKAGKPMNNGNAPSSGNDRNGITALLNSMVKPRVDIHAGAVQNLKCSRELFARNRSEVDALIKTYFARGGPQLMLTVVNRDDLASAMEHPEQYQHLYVRVGGFSARFIDLPADVQLEILNRTLY
jgi:pyruvate-formate lyase